jgi:hypothetical protein
MGEMGTIVAEAAQMVNSRPIARSTGDPESGGPITPLHLLLGRMSVEVPQMRFNEEPKLTQRLQFMEDAKKQFWNKWMSQVFGGRMLSHKWTKKERDVAAGDVVLLAEAENDDPTYRMGIVDSVKPREDGHVRTVNIRRTGGTVTPQDHHEAHSQDSGHRVGRLCVRGRLRAKDRRPGLPVLTRTEASNPEGDVPSCPRHQARPTSASSNRSPTKRPNKKQGRSKCRGR